MGVLVCLLTVGQATAFNQEHLDRLLGTKQCPSCDLSGADLTGATLIEANLSGANLKGLTSTGPP